MWLFLAGLELCQFLMCPSSHAGVLYQGGKKELSGSHANSIKLATF